MILFIIKLLFIFLIINSFISLTLGKNNSNNDQTTTCNDSESFGLKRRPKNCNFYTLGKNPHFF